MANRLPEPGQDDGQWGTILNDYLLVSHNDDGTIRDNTVTTSAIVDGTVSESKLSGDVQTKLNAPASGVADDSVSTVKLQDNAVTTAKLNNGAVTDAKIDANAAIAQSKIQGLAASLSGKADTAAVAAKYTKPGSGIPESDLDTGVQGKLNQAAPVQSVAGKTGAVSLVKGDVGLDQVDNTTDANKPISAATQTALSAKANANDVRFTDQRTPIDNTVTTAKLVDGSVTLPKLSSGPASSGQILSYDGTDLVWTTNTPSGTITDASSSTKGIVQLSGDLAGTAGGPTVAKVNGIAISGTPSTGQSLVATSATAASWQTAAAATVTSANITDATTTGRSLVTTTNAASAKTTLGLDQVSNTSDANKPVSTATQTALSAKIDTATATTTFAPKASPTFTGTVTVPTPTNPTDATTKTYVDTQVSAGTADATTSAKGKIQLAGDLAGTAAAPVVAASAITDAKIAAGAAIAQSKIANLTTDLAAKVNTTARGAANGVASLDTNTRVPIAQLGSGTPSTSTYLRGDGSWAAGVGATGDPGPQGIQGPAAQGLVRVEHGTTASTARPANAYMVIWVGSIQPANIIAGDVWLQASTISAEPTLPASGLVAHYRASDLSLSEGGTVTTWANKVTSGAALVAPSTPSQSTPLFHNSGGRKYVTLDGTKDYLDAAIGTVNQASTTIFVGRFVTTGASKTLVGSTDATARNALAQSASGAKFNLYSGTNLPSTVSTDVSWHLIISTYNGTSSSIQVDSVNTIGAGGSENRNGLRIGLNSNMSTWTNMDIAEVAVYNRSLTTTETNNLYSAYKNWYNLP